MTSRLIKQNKTFLAVIILLFVLFGLVIYFGGQQIYENESKLFNKNADAQLLSAREVIKVFFSDSKNDLFFLRDLLSIKNYTNQNFKSADYKNEVTQLFREFARTHRQYYKIRIIDSSGYEIIRIDNTRDGSCLIVPDTQLQDKKHRYYFAEAIKLEKNQLYTSPLDLDLEGEKAEVPYLPVIRLATTLFNNKNKKRGLLILNMYASRVLELLHRNMFLQTEGGDLISLNADRSVNFRKSDFNFTPPAGRLRVSDVENIHYATVEFLPGHKLIVALYNRYPMLKVALYRLILISLVLLALALGLILIIVHLNNSRFRELVRAQKAIIFSLAALSEWRDPETRGHLERTRNYAALLAKQLQKNKKYRKIITDEFIEDLYDAIPLHDIGKVGVPDSVLLKPGKLTPEEYEKIKKHGLIGKLIIQDTIDKFKLKQSFILRGRNICAYHHEKYNGRGYPEGLKGEEIPLEARIFALCDAYDAIRSKRHYKDERSHEEAVRRIKSESGRQFDPDIVNAFLKCEKQFREVSETYNRIIHG